MMANYLTKMHVEVTKILIQGDQKQFTDTSHPAVDTPQSFLLPMVYYNGYNLILPRILSQASRRTDPDL
jgi:hypothetical protein